MKLTKFQKQFIAIFALLVLFGWWDSQQIIPLHILNDDTAWQLYQQWNGPSFYLTSLIIFAILGYTAYILTRDKGLGAGVFAAGYIMFITGVEDVFFFIFGPFTMDKCMPWFNEHGHLTAKVGEFFGVTCVSPTILIGTAITGTIIAYIVYDKLRKKY